MKKNILISFVFIEVLIVLFGSFTIIKMNELSTITQHMYKHPFTVANATKTIQFNIVSMHRYMKDVVLAENNEDMYEAIRRVEENEEAVYKEFNVVFENYLGDIEDIQTSFKMFVKWKSIRDEVIMLKTSGASKMAIEITKNKGYEHINKMDKNIAILVDFAHNKAKVFTNQAVMTKSETIKLIFVSLLALFVFTIFIMVSLLKFLKLSQDKSDEQNEKIYESEEHFRRLSEISPVAIYMTDINGKCTYTNNVWQELSGLGFEETLGDGWLDAVYEEDREKVFENWNKMVSSNGTWGQEYRFINREGKKTWLYGVARTLTDSDGNVIGYVGANTDITSLKEKDKQLIQHSRMAQMGEMISMIAHQWRQPLSAVTATTMGIRVKVELGPYDFETEKDRCAFKDYLDKSLDDIDDYVQNLSATINDFRDFYKPNKETILMSPDEIILYSLKIVEATLKNQNIRLIKELDSRDKIEMYDKEMMHVILNILKNAQDNFVEKKTAHPYIKITTKENRINICDNGGGINEEYMEKIFEPYFSTKTEKNGTGLGLYMSKIIVEEHHRGNLKAINQADGVCFSMEIGKVKKR